MRNNRQRIDIMRRLKQLDRGPLESLAFTLIIDADLLKDAWEQGDLALAANRLLGDAAAYLEED